MVNIQFVNFTSLPPYGTEHFLLCLLFASFFSYFSGKLLLKCDNYLICVSSLVIFDIFNSFIIMLYFLISFPGFRVSFLLLFLHHFSLCCHLLVWLPTCGGYLILSRFSDCWDPLGENKQQVAMIWFSWLLVLEKTSQVTQGLGSPSFSSRRNRPSEVSCLWLSTQWQEETRPWTGFPRLLSFSHASLVLGQTFVPLNLNCLLDRFT